MLRPRSPGRRRRRIRKHSTPAVLGQRHDSEAFGVVVECGPRRGASHEDRHRWASPSRDRSGSFCPSDAMRATTGSIDTAVVDVDGTLVDSNYQQVLAWSRAFVEFDVPVESWRLHRFMGMGGDRLVAAVAGEAVEARSGSGLRDRWRHHYDELISDVQPLDGAAELMDALADQGLNVVVASSGQPEHTDWAMKLVGRGGRYPSTDAEDAEATKPSPDLVRTAVEKVGGSRAVMIGDTVWDVEAARRCGFPTLAVLTGGIAQSALQDAGAVVFASPRDLLNNLGDALHAIRGVEPVGETHGAAGIEG